MTTRYPYNPAQRMMSERLRGKRTMARRVNTLVRASLAWDAVLTSKNAPSAMILRSAAAFHKACLRFQEPYRTKRVRRK